jgi:hypothetical protein
MKSLVRRLGGNRRVIVIAGVVVLLLVLGGYILWGNATWANYHSSYGQRKDETKTDIDTVLKMPASSTKERAAKLKALLSASEGSTSQDKLCAVNSMVGWQQAINGSYKKWQQECESTQASIDSLNSELAIIAAYMKSDQALSTVLSEALAATDKKVTETSFSSVLSNWKAAAVAVKEMDAPTGFAPVKAKAQKAVTDVEAAWQALVAAHTAKDEAKYEKALKTLPGVYSAIGGIEQESAKQTAALSKIVQSRYDAAF